MITALLCATVGDIDGLGLSRPLGVEQRRGETRREIWRCDVR